MNLIAAVILAYLSIGALLWIVTGGLETMSEYHRISGQPVWLLCLIDAAGVVLWPVFLLVSRL